MIVSSSSTTGTIMAFHHGISKKEPVSGIIPMRDAQTNVIALLAFSNDADPLIFPLDTPVLITSINKGLAGAGTQGNLRSSLETIAAITNPTLIVVRISDPFVNNNFDASTVIGTTLSTGQRTGLQAFLTAKSILGLTPKILVAPDVESPAVVQSLASICKKLRAYSYITPRDEFGIMLETEQQVVAYRDTLAFREIEIVWPEWTSDNVFLGAESTEISCVGATESVMLNFAKNVVFKIIHNGTEIYNDKIAIGPAGQSMSPILMDLVALEASMTGPLEIFNRLEFKNLTLEPQRFEITAYAEEQLSEPATPLPFFLQLPQLNQSLHYEDWRLSDDGTIYSKVTFCLSQRAD